MAISAKEKLQVNCHTLEKTHTLGGILNRLNQKMRKSWLLLWSLLEKQKQNNPYSLGLVSKKVCEKHGDIHHPT